MYFTKFASISDLIKQASEQTELKKKIIEFFSKNPNPKDEEDIHKLADDLGVNKHKLEEAIYSLLGGFLAGGKSQDYSGSYDQKELEMAKKVEREHITISDPEIADMIAEKIGKDHLSEFGGKLYYTLLKLTEKILEEITKGK